MLQTHGAFPYFNLEIAFVISSRSALSVRMDVSSVALAAAMLICAEPVAGERFSIVSKCSFHLFSFEVMSLRMAPSAAAIGDVAWLTDLLSFRKFAKASRG